MKKLVVVAALLAGCATPPSATPFVSPDGKSAFLIACGDGGMPACHAEARRVCGGNYSVTSTVDSSRTVSNPVTGQVASLAYQRLQIMCA